MVAVARVVAASTWIIHEHLNALKGHGFGWAVSCCH
jgi:hypothetical protein